MKPEPTPRTPWPHAPPHWLAGTGTFMVTASTRRKAHHLRTPERLDFFQDTLFELAEHLGWALEAWAIFSNHYHLVARSPETARSLSTMIKRIHGRSSRWINQQDRVQGRQVWMNYRESELTFPKSYYARLNYVHRNAVHHGLVRVANQYPWCSAGWFERNATRAQVGTIYGFKTDKVQVEDEYDPVFPESNSSLD